MCAAGASISTTDLITQFEEETGIKVNYNTAPSNEELYSQLQTGGVNYDVIVPSDYMIARLIEEDMLQPLDYSKIPNYEKIGEQYKNLSFDPKNEYTVPYTWGTLGIIYNTTMVDEPITSWGAMFSDEYAGNILLIDNSRDAFGMALYYLGYDVNTTDEAQIREAYQLVADAKARGVYDGQGMDEIFQIMEGGNLAIATYYAGDYLTMYEANPDLAFVMPDEGSNWFVDAMCILKDAKNVDEAHEWINFIASTESNLRNMDFIWYASPNTEALERYHPPTMRRPTASPWTWICTRSWPPPTPCWRTAPCMRTCRRTPWPCTTTCGSSWAPNIKLQSRAEQCSARLFSL